MGIINKKRNWVLVTLMIAITLIVGCSSDSSTSENEEDLPEVEIRVSGVNSADHPQTIGLNIFKDIVEEGSDGKITVQVHPNSELGGERETVEQVKNGTLEMATSSVGPLTSFDDTFMVLDIPFLFSNYEQAWMFLDSPKGQELLNSLESEGLKGLSYMENGFRHITNNTRPIETPEDLSGVKIRTMEAPMHIENFETLGANPTPVPWPDLYMSMSQGIVDGQENPIANMWDIRMDEVQKYVSLTGHIYDPMPLVTNLEWFNDLPGSYQELIQKAAVLGQNYSRFVNKSREDEILDLLEENGMEINDVTEEQKAKFSDAAQEVVTEKIKEEIDPEFVEDWLEAIEESKAHILQGVE